MTRRHGLWLILICLMVVTLGADQGRKIGWLRRHPGPTESGGQGGDPLNTASDNANFDALCARPDALWCVSFRTAQHNTDYSLLVSPSAAADASYDSTEDMGVMTWATNEVSSEQLRASLGNGHPADDAIGSVTNTGTSLAHPVSGTQKVLIQLDNKWDTSWFTEFVAPGGAHLGGWKWIQLTDNTIMFEPGLGNVGDIDTPWGTLTPKPLAWDFYRVYNVPVPPTANEPPSNGNHCGISLTADLVGLMVDNGDPLDHLSPNCFLFYANRRTRIWIEMIHVAGETFDTGAGGIRPYARFSVWLADEQQAPVKVLSDAKHTCDVDFHEEFWIEYDTSAAERSGGTLKAWFANLVVLKDYSVNPETLMEKPVGNPDYGQTFNALNTAVLHGQDSWVGFNASGETNYTVQTTTTYEGAKAVQVPIITHSTIDRALPAAETRGSLFVRMRKTHNSGSDQYVILRDGGDVSRMFVRMGADGNMSVFSNAIADYVAVSTYAANTWYWVQLEFNDTDQPDKYRARVKTDAGAWSAWSAWVTVSGGSYASITTLRLDTEGSGATSDHVGFYDALYFYGN